MQAGWSLFALAGAKGLSLLEPGALGPISQELAGGWRYSGGFAGLLVGTLVLRPLLLPAVSLARYADWMAPAFALAHAAMRVSCFLNGCCIGEVCRSGFCLSYAPMSTASQEQFARGALATPLMPSEPVLPLQLLFLAAALLVGLGLLRFDRHRRFDGQTFLLFLVLHEGSKAGLELLRFPQVPMLQVAALVPALFGAGALAIVMLRGRQRAASA